MKKNEKKRKYSFPSLMACFWFWISFSLLASTILRVCPIFVFLHPLVFVKLNKRSRSFLEVEEVLLLIVALWSNFVVHFNHFDLISILSIVDSTSNVGEWYALYKYICLGFDSMNNIVIEVSQNNTVCDICTLSFSILMVYLANFWPQSCMFFLFVSTASIFNTTQDCLYYFVYTKLKTFEYHIWVCPLVTKSAFPIFPMISKVCSAVAITTFAMPVYLPCKYLHPKQNLQHFGF